MVKYPCGICQKVVATKGKPFVMIYIINGYIQGATISTKQPTLKSNIVIRIGTACPV